MIMEEKCFGPIRVIPGDNQGKYPCCHSIYIEGAGVLIDPASNRRRLAQLRENPGVKAVWLSHVHEDHIAHLDLFDDLPLWVSEQDAPPLSDLEGFLDWYDIEENEDGYRHYWREAMVNQFHFRPRNPAGFLQGGDLIQLETLTVEVIHTPGHTPGNISLLFKEPEVLFLGDYDLTPFGPWYGDRYSSIDQTIASVNLLRKVPAKIWLTSHETGLFEEEPGIIWDQYLAVISDRENRLLHFLNQPRTLAEITDAWLVYGRPREPRAVYAFGEKLIMKKHLDHLIDRSLIIQEGERFVKVSNQ